MYTKSPSKYRPGHAYKNFNLPEPQLLQLFRDIIFQTKCCWRQWEQGCCLISSFNVCFHLPISCNSPGSPNSISHGYPNTITKIIKSVTDGCYIKLVAAPQMRA